MWLFLVWLGWFASRVSTVLGADSIASGSIVRLSDGEMSTLRSSAVEVWRPNATGPGWVQAKSLYFGACTSGVRLRIALEAPHAGLWWWTSELRTPEELRMRLGARELGAYGTALRFADRPAGSLPVAIPLDLHGGPETLFVTASDPQGDLLLDVRWIPDAKFPAFLQSHAARDAWVLGVFTAVFLVAAYLWWTVRERAFFWYALYVATGLLWVATKTGFAAWLLWPDHPAWNHAGPSFASRASLVLFLLFLRALVDLRTHFPRLDRLLVAGIAWEALCAAFAVTSVVFPSFHAVVLRHFPPEVLEAPTLLLGLGLVTWRARTDPLARRIAFSSLPLVGAAIFGALWDPLHPEGAPNLDTPVAIGGALLENLLTTWVLVDEVRRRVMSHEGLLRDFERRLSEAFERYRAKTSSWLHDDLSQRLLAARMALYAEGFRSPGEEKASADAQLQDLATAIRNLSHDLHPWLAGSRSFQEALEDLASSFGATKVAVKLDLQADFDLLPAVGQELLRVAQEASSNAVRHGRARRVDIATRVVGNDLELSIRDDGKGMNPSRSATGRGLRNIRSRIDWLGGTVGIESAVGEGTTLRVRVPLERARA